MVVPRKPSPAHSAQSASGQLVDKNVGLLGQGNQVVVHRVSPQNTEPSGQEALDEIRRARVGRSG